ncbi:DUF3313 family protein [Brevundimonas naejangsanensis]|uniref:DUF3313 family protein n=1 Tax=Brevundimonas naejangsanensis TaxID=588932 RepID=UPI0013C3E4F3|nr:DUF3313 family protein [Brevundimonas naejangsanensis]
MAATVGACATAEVQPGSGFLSTYEGLEPRTDVVRASVLQRRNETLASTVARIWVAPAELFGVADPALSDDEQQMVLSEVDRQLCYELSERFEIAEQQDPQAGTVRVGVTHIRATHQAGSAAAAVANFFIPGPIKVRTPGGMGGLGAEAELLTPDGRQAAAIVWRRDAMVVGTDKPSLSRIGDAHQLAEPLGDMVADALAPEDRETRATPSPDPCRRFGPRIRPEGFIAGIATGLYQPELSGGRSVKPEGGGPQ